MKKLVVYPPDLPLVAEPDIQPKKRGGDNHSLAFGSPVCQIAEQYADVEHSEVGEKYRPLDVRLILSPQLLIELGVSGCSKELPQPKLLLHRRQ